MKTKLQRFQTALRGALALSLNLALTPAAVTTGAAETAPAKASIPWSQLGAKAGADYKGEGLAVTQTAEGARLRCVFQRLEGEATQEGLWLTSTLANVVNDRFRIVAADVRRLTPTRNFDPETRNAIKSLQTLAATDQAPLSRTGSVQVADQRVRFLRSGVIEEYSVSVDGVRQDFVILQKPEGDGELRLELDVDGARTQSTASGAQLALENSGRKIAYTRLRATDATGKQLSARMEVAATTRQSAAVGEQEEGDGGLPTRRFARLAVVVNDADAVYPVRVDPTLSDANWISMGGIPGTDYVVSAAVADGSGDLYIGGSFTVVGEVIANHIAKWDGSNWSALDSGINDWVSALAVSGSNLYAGGEFTTAGGVSATNIAKWNGSSWSVLSSGVSAPGDPYSGGRVSALAVSGSDLYAGGYFKMAGGVAATNIAKWNGSSWSALGSGISAPSGDPYYSGSVHTLAVSGSDLFAGGAFTTAGGSPAANMAKWNGSSWSALGLGMSSTVFALAASGSDVYAGGNFSTAGGSTANNIAKWNGSNWSPLGSGLNNIVVALAVSGSDLYAGGTFTTAGGSVASYIAKWNGSSWNTLGSGMDYYVSALAVSGSDLFAGGSFTTAGDSAANYIAKWNGSSWSPLGSGMAGDIYSPPFVSALAVSGSDLYAGGLFRPAGGSAANSIAKWNGSSWSALGPGISGEVFALAVSGNGLYAGGYYVTTAGDGAANYIVKWNGSSWSALGSEIGSDPTSDPIVSALAVSGSDLYAGGSFTTAGGAAATNIAKWNGSSWSALGSGISAPTGDPYYGGSVHTLAVSGSDLYAGGYFTTAGGVAASNIAKWNGSSWSALGSGMNGGVSALVVSGSDLYAGGEFTTAGGSPANYITKWNGNSWSALGSGISARSDNPYYDYYGAGVYALAVSGSDLYAGGSFLTAGGKVSAYMARAVVNPPLLTIEPDGARGYFIRFSGVPGTAYRLQRTPALAGPWASSAPQTAPASGLVGFWDIFPPPGQGFYRAIEP